MVAVVLRAKQAPIDGGKEMGGGKNNKGGRVVRGRPVK